MSDPARTPAEEDYEFTPPSPEEMHSALFGQLVMQQANMAALLLGHTPHPETGKTVRDLEAAKLFIDQLEMLEVKTKGNLSKEEDALLKQNLMALRLAFVEAVETPAPESESKGTEKLTPSAAPSQDEELKKRFSRKF